MRAASDTLVGAEPSNAPLLDGTHRLAHLFVAPAAAFRDLAVAPRWRTALVFLAGVAIVVAAVVLSRLDLQAVVDRALAGRDSESPREAALEAAAVRGTVRTMVLVSPALMLLYHAVTSGALWLGLQVLGAGLAYTRIFATVLHAAVPPALCKGLIVVASVLRRDDLALDDLDTLVVSNVGAFLPEGSPHPLQVAGEALDLFTAWKWVLIVVGLSIVGRMRRRRVAFLAIALWGGWLLVRAVLLPWMRPAG